MGCCGEREKGPPEQKQKWEFINLADFKCTSFWTPLAYGWLWFMGGVGVAVYAVDTFTAINLLAFDKWSSQVEPAIPIKYSKWIFAGCIFFSWALCIYEWMRAIRVIKRGGVAASYMDPVAASLQCMRSKGWRRFLVFTALTKSKKGTDYVAFFVYFAFQGAIRIIIAEGPRQVVNALTLYAVMQAKLINQPDDDHSNVEQFFLNVQSIAEKNYQLAVIYGSMLFTLVIWVISALCLILAGVLYIVFLWHYIPQRDGRLRIYCRRKVDRRLEKIVVHKVQAAIEDEAKKKEKAEKKAELKRQKTGELPPPQPPKIARQPTLPQLGEDSSSKADDKLPDMPLSRQDTNATMSTLPVYSSRPPTSQGIHRQPTLPDMALGGERPGVNRMNTQGSNWTKASFESDAPLLANAGYAGGNGRPNSPATLHSQYSNASSYNRSMPGRNMSHSTQASQRSFTPTSRNGSTMSRPPPVQRFPVRSNTGFSYEEPRSAVTAPSPVDTYGRTFAPPPRANTTDGFRPGPMRKDSEISYFSRPVARAGPDQGMPVHQRQNSLHSQQASISTATTVPSRKPLSGGSFSRPFAPSTAPSRSDQRSQPPNSYEMTSQPSYGSLNSAPPAKGGFVAFNPSVHNGPHQDPRRNITVGGHPGAHSNYFGHVDEVPQRSATEPNAFRGASTYGGILDDYGAYTPDQPEQDGIRRVSPPSGPPRANTAGPGPGGWQNQNRF